MCVAAGATLSCSDRRLPSPPSPARLAAHFNRLMFAGDVMLSRGVRREILAFRDPSLPFRKIAPLLASADLAFVNLESPFSDKGPYYDEGLIFHAAPDMIAGLLLAHVAIASTANNHARDCGPHGVEYTFNWLSSHGIAPLGSNLSATKTHRGVVLERNGIRFGFLGYTFDQKNGNWRDIDDRIAVTDANVMAKDIDRIKTRCDVVIVSMHNGTEYAPRANPAQIAFAHAAIDAGATLVIGHHPHVVQPVERYKGKLIFYSLGNFVFDQFQREATQQGVVAEVDFLGKGIFCEGLWPVTITRTGPELSQR